MRHVLEQCDLFARVKRPLVLVGPIGVGKTTLAREVHRRSGRTGELVLISTGELTETLQSDRLFGHVQGAFTGADKSRKGAFAEAAGGTLLLDDLALIPRLTQDRILRVLESAMYRPLGASRDEQADCRMILASTKEPADLVEEGHLLPDLASRLGGFIVLVPPLRERRLDIVPLAEHAGRRMVLEHGHSGTVSFSDEARALLENYPWKWNVRELLGVVERAVAVAGMDQERIVVQRAHLPRELRTPSPRRRPEDVTPQIVYRAVRNAGGNKSLAARQIGVHRNTINRKLELLDLD
jgi:DNA-binding NtrC family response regulator